MPIFATAGSKVFIGTALAATAVDFVAADFSAQTWTQIGSLESIGSLGDTSTEITFDDIGNPSLREHHSVLRGRKRQNVIREVMDALDDWRLSRWQHEGETRAGIRSALCMSGHGWQTSDTEAATIIDTALRRLGIEDRPSWIEGQNEYRDLRVACADCGNRLSP